MAKVTPWYPGDVKPVRVGVYERDHVHDVRYSYWNGHYWGGWAKKRTHARNNKDAPSALQSIPWRGIARTPRPTVEDRR